MIIWSNLGSFLLGLTAWALALTRLFSRRRRGELWSLFSFSACAAALCLQFLGICRRAVLGDWSALLDTADTLAETAVLLVAVTFLLNLAAMALCAKKR